MYSQLFLNNTIIKHNDYINHLKTKYNINNIIELIYNIYNIPYPEYKQIKNNSTDYIYLESEQLKESKNIKVFGSSYYYKDTPRKKEYIENYLETLKILYDSNNIFLQDYYIYLFIDFTTILNINNDNILKDFIKKVISYKNVLFQFYYHNENIELIGDKLCHHNSFGMLARFLPFIINDNIDEYHIRDMDTTFGSYLTYLQIQDFNNSNKCMYLYNTLYNPESIPFLIDHKNLLKENKYNFYGGLMGFKKIDNFNNIKVIKEFQQLLIKFIKNEVNGIINNKYKSYAYAYDEIMLLYYYKIIKEQNIDNNIKFYDSKKAYNYQYNTNMIFNKIVSKTNQYIILLFIITMCCYLYNYKYIILDENLYKEYEFIFKKYNVNIIGVNRLLNKILDTEDYKKYKKIFKFKTKEDLKQYIINILIIYQVPIKGYDQIKFEYSYDILY